MVIILVEDVVLTEAAFVMMGIHVTAGMIEVAIYRAHIFLYDEPAYRALDAVGVKSTNIQRNVLIINRFFALEASKTNGSKADNATNIVVEPAVLKRGNIFNGNCFALPNYRFRLHTLLSRLYLAFS